MKKDIPDLHFTVNGEGELPEHSGNLLSQAREVIEVMETNECPQKACKLCSNSLQNSDICEQLGNLLRNVVKMMPRRCDYDGESKQGPNKDSECGKYLPVPHLMTSAEETDVLVTQKQEGIPCTTSRRATGGDDSSEFLQESSNCVGNNVSVPGITWFKSVSKLVGLAAAWQPSKVEGHSRGVNTVGSPKAYNNSVHTEFNFFL